MEVMFIQVRAINNVEINEENCFSVNDYLIAESSVGIIYSQRFDLAIKLAGVTDNLEELTKYRDKVSPHYFLVLFDPGERTLFLLDNSYEEIKSKLNSLKYIELTMINEALLEYDMDNTQGTITPKFTKIIINTDLIKMVSKLRGEEYIHEEYHDRFDSEFLKQYFSLISLPRVGTIKIQETFSEIQEKLGGRH